MMLLTPTLLILLGACSSPPEQSQPPPEPTQQSDQAVLGRHGGRLVLALAGDPKTFNPVTMNDIPSRTVIHRMMADLIHIDRFTQQTVPGLAESWTISEDGRTYTLRLRKGLRFSDGAPCTADDVVFSFEVYLDQESGSSQRDLLIVGGEPIQVRKLDSETVVVELAQPYAVAERMFDGFAILPRHLLEETYRSGGLQAAWGLGTASEEIAGLGPFRLREYVAGERLVLERNPYYWKHDRAGAQLPYLDELVFLLIDSAQARMMRFEAGEIDMLDLVDAASYAVLADKAERHGWRVSDLGPGLVVRFFWFNQNDLSGRNLPDITAKQVWFQDLGFRRAVSMAIDRDAIVRLVYHNRATPMMTHVSPGNKLWINRSLPPPGRSLDEARRLLAASGFSRDEQGLLRDSQGRKVELSLLATASNKMAPVIQEDLRQIGIEVGLATLEFQAILDRVLNTFDYETCLLSFGGGDADPNPFMSTLLSNGEHHLWRLDQDHPETPWQAEIDQLMRDQMAILSPEERKRMYDQVQQLVAENLPFISLVSPNILVAAKKDLGNFRPAILQHHTLWNVEELFWNKQP
jgi:peptide/nickel transport system substrate-binding protein